MADETETTDELAEEAAFNARAQSLVPETESQFEVVEDVEGKVGEKAEPELPAETPEEKAAEEEAKAFIGDLTEEEVLLKLNRADTLEDDVFERVSRKIMGKFGEVGQQLKDLQEREFRFDPEKLVKTRAADEGLAEALSSDLVEALTAGRVDSDAITSNAVKAVVGDLSPYIEQRFFDYAVPDADEIVKTKEFEEWFYKEASQRVRDTFEDWDNRTRMDGLAMAKAFKQFDEFVEAKAERQKSKEESLKKSVETQKTPAAPPARRHMSEEEAFNARLKELQH